MRKYLIVTSVVIFLFPLLNAQEISRCRGVLEDAREAYQSGLVELVPSMLQSCIQSGFSGEELQEAYKLVINSYLFDYLPDQADSMMLKFLAKFPDYKPTEEDPAEFVLLLESYDLVPSMSYGFHVGTTLSFPRVTEPYSFGEPLASGAGFAPAGPGLQVGGNYNLNFNRYLESCFGLEFLYNRFRYTADPFPFAHIESTESQNLVQIPVSILLNFNPSGRVIVYMKAGLSAGFLLSSSVQATRYYTETDNVVYKDVVLPAQKITDQRSGFSLLALGGLGLKYNISGMYLFLESRFNYGLTLSNKEAMRYDNQDLTWLIYYVDSDFKTNYVSVTAGMAWNLFNPKKIY